jgi:hypothetical protein
MPGDDLFAFDISLHALASEATAGGMHHDAWGAWPVLQVPSAALVVPLAVPFDDAFARLGCLERMFAEPDGSFVWTSPREGLSWQVDGNALEREDRVLLVDLKGTCPETAFDRLLAAFGWPDQRLMMQLVRPAVFLDEATFRRHARCRAAARDAKTLRPG